MKRSAFAALIAAESLVVSCVLQVELKDVQTVSLVLEF